MNQQLQNGLNYKYTFLALTNFHISQRWKSKSAQDKSVEGTRIHGNSGCYSLRQRAHSLGDAGRQFCHSPPLARARRWTGLCSFWEMREVFLGRRRGLGSIE